MKTGIQNYVPLPASKFASYFGNFNSKFFKILHNFQIFEKKIQNFEFFLEISKTTEGPPLTSKGCRLLISIIKNSHNSGYIT